MSEEFSFDSYAASYDEALTRGISVSGEDKNYFARGRLAWVTRCLNELGESPRTTLDFGCGTGSATPFFLEMLGVDKVVGVDVSTRSIEAARQQHGSPQATFLSVGEYEPGGEIDLAFCNGVFHHIPLLEREAAVRYICRSLRPGGLFALWENNPWNPGARLVMARIPFDRDAVMLTPSQTRQLVRRAGLEVISTDFMFIFPRGLKWLRGCEAWLARWPLGAQYQVLCRRPRT